ncbi:MAG: hypothetical protein SGILL_005177 [Bacillariaceae sp.]
MKEWNDAQNNMTAYLEAARQVSKSQKECHLCDPENCSSAGKAYLDLQSSAPPPVHSAVHFLKSIPRRFPLEAFENETQYYSLPQHQYPNTALPLVEYNPTIVQLPSDIKEAYRRRTSGSIATMQSTEQRPLYLAAYRVTDQHVCLLEPQSRYLMQGNRWGIGNNHQNYLGLALLDSELQIIEDVTVQTKAALGDFEDPRLFVLHGDVYVGSFRHLHQLFFEFGGGGTDNSSTCFAKDPSKKQLLPAISDSAITGNDVDNSLRVYTRKNDKLGSVQHAAGKNLNYFVDAHNRTILETRPLEDKMEIINLTHSGKQLAHNETMDPAINWHRNASQVPPPSFATLDEYDVVRKQPMDIAPFYPERGSACCVPITDPNTGRTLMLGVSHSKTKFKYKDGQVGDLQPNHFSSSFYAMENEPPYAVVARTGRFCLGTGRDANWWEQDGNHNDNPYYERRVARGKLWLLREYDCPIIHYVSGMVEKADDSSKIIIAYGVMDWYVHKLKTRSLGMGQLS